MDMYSRIIPAANARQQEVLTTAATMRRIKGSETTRLAPLHMGHQLRHCLGAALITLGTRLQNGLPIATGSPASLSGAH